MDCQERAWLSEAPAQMLQQAVRDCDQAYKNIFDSLKGRRVGRKSAPVREGRTSNLGQLLGNFAQRTRHRQRHARALSLTATVLAHFA